MERGRRIEAGGRGAVRRAAGAVRDIVADDPLLGGIDAKTAVDATLAALLVFAVMQAVNWIAAAW